MVEANVKIIAELKLFLDDVSVDPDIRCLFTNNTSDLIRDRKLPFRKLAIMLANLPKRSLSIELRDFFSQLSDGSSCTKGAFSLQRTKLKPIFFSIWNKYLVDNFYHYYQGSVKKWGGFRLLAIDGSTTYLFDKPDVKAHFGTQQNQHGGVPMARVMQIHDVLNDLTLWGGIFPIGKSEQQIMSSNINHLPTDSLCLFDRGYPSYSLMYLLLHQESPRHFVMRCRSNFSNVIKDFIKSGKHSSIVELKPDERAQKQLLAHGYIITSTTSIKVRLVKIKLPNGVQEVLLTSLYDERLYGLQALKQIYALRWGIETTYNKQKNQLQLEIFTGHRVICIQQDYAAMLFTANLQSLIEKQTEPRLKRINKRRKHLYKINRNISWAAMKNRIVQLFSENESYTILQKLEVEFAKYIEPIRPHRVYPRIRKANRIYGKYQTQTNYRRAI